MCSIFYPGEIVLENASCYRVIALHTRRSVCVLPNTTTGETPHVCTRAKVVISCSTFSNADHCYYLYIEMCNYGLSMSAMISLSFIKLWITKHNIDHVWQALPLVEIKAGYLFTFEAIHGSTWFSKKSIKLSRVMTSE